MSILSDHLKETHVDTEVNVSSKRLGARGMSLPPHLILLESKAADLSRQASKLYAQQPDASEDTGINDQVDEASGDDIDDGYADSVAKTTAPTSPTTKRQRPRPPSSV